MGGKQKAQTAKQKKQKQQQQQQRLKKTRKQDDTPALTTTAGPGDNQDWTLHPYLQRDSQPNSQVWYVVPADAGVSPGMRMGASACNIGDNRVLFFGGATPERAFNDIAFIDYGTATWHTCSCQSELPPPRYDHAAVYAPEHHAMYIFGGSNNETSFNDTWRLDLESLVWEEVVCTGSLPSPRVVHNMVLVNGQIYVIGGGISGMQSSDDSGMFVLDLASRVWKEVATTGDAPPQTQGHAMCAFTCDGAAFIAVHGGLSSSGCYGDLHVLNTASLVWKRYASASRRAPAARTGHRMCALHTTNGTDQSCLRKPKLLLFGGLSMSGMGAAALDDTYLFDLESEKWKAVKISTKPPGGRLDFAMAPVSGTNLNAPIPSNEGDTTLSGSTASDDDDDDDDGDGNGDGEDGDEALRTNEPADVMDVTAQFAAVLGDGRQEESPSIQVSDLPLEQATSVAPTRLHGRPSSNDSKSSSSSSSSEGCETRDISAQGRADIAEHIMVETIPRAVAVLPSSAITSAESQGTSESADGRLDHGAWGVLVYGGATETGHMLGDCLLLKPL